MKKPSYRGKRESPVLRNYCSELKNNKFNYNE
jgi:hypothetical protein